MKFEELSLHEDLLKAIQDLGFSEMTPIQVQAIPVALSGKDIVGIAQTGTGKTIAFLLPIINKMLNENLEGLISLILAPTRELVIQIAEEAGRLLKYSSKKVFSIIGGTGYKEQEKELSEEVNILVATPGRLIDHIKSGNLDLSKIRFFVLDEADRMFDMGFIKDIRYVMRKCPSEKQVMLYSATLSYYVMRLASDYLKDPVEVRIDPEKIVTENIQQTVLHLASEEKLPYLVNSILTKDTEEGLGIIFTNLKILVPKIVSTLRRYGIPVTGLSSMLDQKKRVRLLKEFKLGKYKYMVATDVASRGIDIDNIKVVYNFDLPFDVENYVHRIGRTARAGRSGRAISFCSERDYTELEKIEKFLGYKIPVGEIDESMLKFPQGEFTPLQMKENETSAKKETYLKQRVKVRKKEKIVKKNRLPIDEAVALIEKADQVLEKVKKPKVKSNKIPRTKKSIQKVQPTQEDLKTYDKSKRNLFDINDQENYKPRKVSIWKKIKSFFGF